MQNDFDPVGSMFKNLPTMAGRNDDLKDIRP